jgi:hypothetical protein
VDNHLQRGVAAGSSTRIDVTGQLESYLEKILNLLSWHKTTKACQSRALVSVWFDRWSAWRLYAHSWALLHSCGFHKIRKIRKNRDSAPRFFVFGSPCRRAGHVSISDPSAMLTSVQVRCDCDQSMDQPNLPGYALDAQLSLAAGHRASARASLSWRPCLLYSTSRAGIGSQKIK